MTKFIIQKHKTCPLHWWYSIRGDIDFEPPYQRRDKIWPVGSRAYLIDSILNGFDIPKFYLADFRLGKSKLNTKNKMYAIIDGKQRFSAIFEFFSDNLKIGQNRPFIYQKDPALDLTGLTYSELRAKYPQFAQTIENYEIDVMSVWSERRGPIEELFVRLNSSFHVIGIERRNAIPGLVMDITRDLAKHPFFRKKINFDTKRMAEMNAANKLLWLEYNGKLMDTKKVILDRFAEAATKDSQFDVNRCTDAGTRTKANLTKMSEVFLDRDKLLSSSGLIPLYYQFIKKTPAKELASVREFLGAFEELRKENALKKEEGRSDVDNELLLFDKQRRSPNDAKAMEIMCEILLRYFQNR